jgi:hypothetical protein
MTRYRNVIAGVAVFSAALALGAQVNAQMTTPESQGQQRGGGQRRMQTPAASAEAAARGSQERPARTPEENFR